MQLTQLIKPNSLFFTATIATDEMEAEASAVVDREPLTAFEASGLDAYSHVQPAFRETRS
jgi:hypothetical protein